MKFDPIKNPCYCQAHWAIGNKGKTCVRSARELVGKLKLCGQHAKVARRGFMSKKGEIEPAATRATGKPVFDWADKA